MWLLLSSLLLLACSIHYAIDFARTFFIQHATLLQNAFVRRRGMIVLVIAHPDDECMFFSPTIRSLLQMGHCLRIICLSTGNYDGLGVRRKRELLDSAARLGVPSEDCLVIDDERLEDSPKKRWQPAVIAQVLQDQLAPFKDQIIALLTFDKDGISGHPNHCDTSTGVRFFAARTTLGQYDLLELESVSLLIKYTGGLAIIYEMAHAILEAHLTGAKPQATPTSRRLISIIPQSDTWTIPLAAMSSHASQLVWFRYLYLLFSRYIHLNTLIWRRPFSA